MINHLAQLTLAQITSLPSWPKRKTQLICVNIIQETVDVKTFQFKAEPAQLFHFKPGQFIGLQLEINTEKHHRSYTIASSPTKPHLLELTIKRDPLGIVSPWLHENLAIGSQLEVRGPAGKFNCLDIACDKVLLIGAGSGITPLMSMARFWGDLAVNKDIYFLYWCRSAADIIFRRELALLDHQHTNFHLEVFCTQPDLSENWLGRRGRINKTVLHDLVADLHQRTVFCCGPDGFMQQVKSSLNQLSFNMNNYHDETFDPGGKKKRKLQAAKNIAQDKLNQQQIFRLTLVKSGRILDVSSQEMLLRRLEDENINIDSACRVGNCGTCKVKKVSGETITENQNGLTEKDKKKGIILTCTTRLKSNVVLDI